MTAAPHHPTWHLITGEYPPQPGGVSDYTEQLALALFGAGEDVHIWVPRSSPSDLVTPVTVHAVPDFGTRGLQFLSTRLAEHPGPKRLLVEYVAPAFGYKGLNIPFVLWLASRHEELWVHFHEVAQGFAWTQPLRHNVLAAVESWMARVVADHASRVFISIPGWRRQLGRHGLRAEVMPIPSTLPVEVSTENMARTRVGLGPGLLVGHFGTYGRLVTNLLEPAVISILRSTPEVRFVLLGRGGPEFAARLASIHPELAARLVAPGVVDAATAASYIAVCDVLVQPYPDGITARRTSVMAGLALGKAIVTTSGHLTEVEWAASDVVRLAPVGDTATLTQATIQLLSIRAERDALGRRASTWYASRFSIERTLALLGVECRSDKVDSCGNVR